MNIYLKKFLVLIGAYVFIIIIAMISSGDFNLFISAMTLGLLGFALFAALIILGIKIGDDIYRDIFKR
ncbi:MAG: hypothetical protein QME58_03665 [Bacteroidota bacterium]|nr:hypothetical protein [Bacteroidota bacterium]